MDMECNSLNETKKLEQIVSQFLLKCLHVILDSRIPSLHSHDDSGDLSSHPRVRKSEKWFNLALGDPPGALNNLNFWHRNIMDPMIIDIILVHNQSNSASIDKLYAAAPAPAVSSSSVETVIERWVVQYESLPRAVSPQSGESFLLYKKTYQKSIILLRSLYMQMRLLPAYRIIRQLSTSSQTYDFDIIYKVSSFSDPFSRVEEEMMKDYIFSSVEALPGRLSVSVMYRPTLVDFNLERSTSQPPMIIMDYVGSPTTDPLRSFPSTEKGVRATSFPLRGLQSPTSGLLQRPHSWTSGFQRAATFTENQLYHGSSPASRISSVPYDFPSPSSDHYGNKCQNVRPLSYPKTNVNDEYLILSPPFSSSPSPSPSPPTYFANGMKSRTHSQTSPVSIPIQMGKSSRYVSPNFSDPNRHSLPPLSPRSIKNDYSSHESSSGIRSYRKEILRSGEFQSGMAISSSKVARDSKDELGRFSGLLSSSGSPRIGFSRCSSRLSFQDDTDDGDFSCPFDDVDTPDFLLSQNAGGKRTLEFTSQSLPLGTKSQDAAVGVLVHMLRTAPPLRQDSSCFASQCLKTDIDEEVTTASGFFMPRKAADALEELRSYREMKDLLLPKSGTRVLNREDI